MMNANERPRLLQAVAIVDHGTLALDPVELDPGIDVARGQGGATYPNKPPGATVPAVLAYSVQRAWCGVLDCAPTLRGLTLLARIFGALVPIVVLAGFASRRCGDDAYARLAVVLVVLATPLQAYAHVLFGHALAALALFVGTTWITDAIRDDAPRLAVRGGACAGAAVFVEYAAVFAALPIGIALVVHARRHGARTLLAAVGGALVPIVVLALYHELAFGSPFATGYHNVTDPGFAELHARGLLGLAVPRVGDVVEDLLSPWGGLLYFAPLVAIAPLAWKHADAHVRLQLAVLATMVLATLCITQAGGWRVGPRYAVAALPALAPALALVLRRNNESLLAWVLGLGLWSLVVNGLAANFFPQLVPTGNPLRDQLVPLVRDGLQPYSVIDGFGGRVPFAGLVPVIGALAMFVVAARGLVSHRRVIAAALVIASAIGLAAWSVPPAEDAAASLAAIESIWEPGGGRDPKVTPLR